MKQAVESRGQNELLALGVVRKFVRAGRGAAVGTHGLVRLKDGIARIAALCAVSLYAAAFFAVGWPKVCAFGML